MIEENKLHLIDILKPQLIWYLVNFLILFFQTYISPDKLPLLNELYLVIFKIIGRSIFISLLLYWTTMIYNLSFEKLGITLQNFISNYILGIRVSLPFLLGIIIIHFSATELNINPFMSINNLNQLILSLIYFFILFIAYLIPAFSKELLYRGITYYYFKQNYGLKVGFLLTIIYYILSYLDFRGEVIIIHFLVAVITTYLYEKTNSLLASTIFQATYQASLSLYLFSFSSWPF